MTINRYFETFPLVDYSNTQVVDITKRTAVLDTIRNNSYLFYPYELAVFERPDQFSARYYDDSFKSWILYLTNKMVDPYHEWYKQPRELDEFCEKKYGDLFTAQNKIKYYRNDYTSSNTLTSQAFNALPQELKKYWIPSYGLNNQLVEYVRRPAEWTTDTNKIVKYTVTGSNNFTKDEIIDIHYNTLNYGKGQVLSIQSNTVYVKHVSGQYFTSNSAVIQANSYLYGYESNTTAIITNFYWVANSIPEAELSYWIPISYYDYEYEKNEYYKTVSVLESEYSKTICDNLRTLMKE